MVEKKRVVRTCPWCGETIKGSRYRWVKHVNRCPKKPQFETQRDR